VKPAKRVRLGDQVLFSPDLRGEVVEEREAGERVLRFSAPGSVREALFALGEMPLPPYIRRKPRAADRERYQTVYAKKLGSAAAPTAGLHFTPAILDECRAAGAEIAHVTLHVGQGTFAPLRGEEFSQIELHKEYFEIDARNAEIIARAKRRVCVGTTSVRALETAMLHGAGAMKGETNLFIYPGFRFAATDALLTNFHLPQSSLLVLVGAFAGHELVLAAYRHAVAARYQFFSYGDCMLIV
jgi:S-adenosylmethionine:tRNA ribosyltransferase-isomerase